jgi:cobyrinic acid a,c-diamide synthase
MQAPALLIAAPKSGSGKTTLTLGLLRAFRRAGVNVGSAKCGPDYIDPMFHEAVTGQASVNLDSWAMPPALLSSLANQVTTHCDLLLCESSMGLFDGVPGPSGRTGSSADVAAALGWPILLILDVSGQSQSAAAVVKGCATYSSDVTIAGVILNRVGSVRHSQLVTRAIDDLGVPVLGALPRLDSGDLTERHLGLVQASEINDLEARLDRMAEAVNKHVDLASVRSLALRSNTSLQPSGIPRVLPPGQRIAVARDAAFSFFYAHILQGWQKAGASVHFFAPLSNEGPDQTCDACWLPGGYPELHAEQLAASQLFFQGLRSFAETRRVHGECGGYMVLGNSLTDANGVTHEMAGLLSVSTSFAKRRLNLGYREARNLTDNSLGRAGTTYRGHEFHYASIVAGGDDTPFLALRDAYGNQLPPSGHQRRQTTGSFLHVIA